MGKSKTKGRRSSANDIAISAAEKPAKPPVSNTDSLPDLSDGILANLTKRIEQRLQGRVGAETLPQKEVKAPTDELGNRKYAGPQAEVKSDNRKEKKRDWNGEVIAPQGAVKGRERPKGKREGHGNKLENEIYAIGGSKEDYDLLAGIDSDSEMEMSAVTPKQDGKQVNENTLRNDIAQMLKGGNPSPASKPPSKKVSVAEAVTPVPASKPSREANSPKESKPSKEPPKKINLKKPTHAEDSESKKLNQLHNSRLSNMVVEPRPDWYAIPLPPISLESTKRSGISRHILDRIREYALYLLDLENQAFAAAQQSLSSRKFYSTIVSSGTLSDKVSALTLAVQESPIHNVKALENLVGLAKKRSRAQAVEVLRSLKDLFAQGTLLPSDRRLKSLANQPALLAALEGVPGDWMSSNPLPNGLERSHLIVWAFEDFLKEQYFEILKILEVWCNDEIEFSRSRAVTYVYELLKEKPEQESNLLRLLVNKLGDPNKKIASRASYLLLQLEQAHPLMKTTIISAIESDILFRPSQSQHAKYYAIITLNQTVLSSGEENVASKLLDIYFGLFVTLLKPAKDSARHSERKHGKHDGKSKKRQGCAAVPKGQAQEDELREKLTAGVLTGVNRAYPFTSSDVEKLSKHIDTLFIITHSSNFNTSIQALMLIQQLSSSHQVSLDRFYRTLYESLLDPRISTSSKQSLYLNLLYKSLKFDLNDKRVKAFVKRLVQILGLHQPPFICGVFYLIRELEKAFPSLSSLMDDPENIEDDDEEAFRDVPEDEEQTVGRAPDQAEKKMEIRYDPRKRDPEHSNADRSCLWELLPFLSHFHPSVSVNASHLLDHTTMSGKPDLSIHTLTHFLDRFAYRNPKAAPVMRGNSIMQPLAGGESKGLLVTSGGTTAKCQEPVNKETFWKKQYDEVAAEDVFFHEYFNRMDQDNARKIKSKKKSGFRGRGGDGDEYDAESEIWKALVHSRPELEGEGGSEDDIDVDDLASAMGDGDDGDLEDLDMDDVESGDDEGELGEEPEDKEAVVAEGSEEFEGFGGEDAFEMDVSDEDAFRDSDEEIPSDLDSEVQELIAAATDKGGKGGKLTRRQKKRKLKHLPVFASVDDYAALLADDDPDGGL
ncbi:CCAAT-box-binding transcription factor [Paracoccidioides lutzii Pb01]|uniref:CCAAT-box-binding transcription factor n=1 Tax=Paracoccidioides lutzii (strain ATCC MYA-826 / Pb01) TaxID=502779 RepID=C1GY93_PARBA|nr:CCAAT-box-binding transcription factor [Paracoccidioides lutzii Pb01]EEH41484.1 CCAAT-box-binding transcription factor [Paracoccidioides lutzii Pb01]